MTVDSLHNLAEERESAEFRLQYYSLLANLLAREPTDEILGVMRNGIAGRAKAARELHPMLGAGWDHLQQMLPNLNAGSAEAEFLRLFVGPYQPELNPYESWYLTGQLFQTPLIALRKFLGQIGLEKREEAFAEPEDYLAFELEVMKWLLTQQLAAGSPEEEREWLHRQAAFLTGHLLIWGPHCSEDMEAAKSAVLYKGVAMLVRGLLAMEKQRLQVTGSAEIETLEQARKRYGSPRTFQGPLFDPAAPPKAGSNPTFGSSDKNK
jgi:TorA maturation chaperone TorD